MRIEGLVKENFLRKVESLRGDRGALEEAAVRVEARVEDPVSAALTLSSALEEDGGSPSPYSPSKKSPGPSPGPKSPGLLSGPKSPVLLQKSPVSFVLKIAHVGIAVKSLAEGGALWDLLGLFETHREDVASQKVMTSFRPVGESFLELLEPSAPDSPIAKALEKRGAGIHHLCLEVADLRATLARLKAAGVRLVNEEPLDGAHGCLVAFVHPSATGGILLELSQKRPKAS
jgi:methylmalonyl-CoA/ethylmalonyl-CoA epimerase